MMKVRNIILLVGLCAALCSCAALGRYEKETAVSPKLYGDAALSEEGMNIANFRWQEVFKDPILQEYIDTAIANNHDYRAAVERIRQAEAQLLGAKLGYTPSLSVPPTINKSFSGTDGFDDVSYGYDVSATSSWQLDIFSKTNNLKSAKASLEQMEDYRQAALSSLIASVAKNYYSLIMLDAQLEAASVMLSNWAESVDAIKILKDCGEADQVAVSQYEANYDNIKIKYQGLQQQIIVTENAMSILLGKEIQRGLKRSALDDQEFDIDIKIGVPVQMLALRPDVRAAERDMEKAFYAKKGALLNFFPKLTLNGSIGMVNPATGAMSPITLLANVGAGLVAPIFSSGRNISAYRTAESKQREARLMFDKKLLTAGKEVNDALSEFNMRLEMTKNYATRVASLQKAFEDTEYLLRNSLDKTYLDVLYANTNYFNAKLEAIENISKMYQAGVSLYVALGGGTIE